MNDFVLYNGAYSGPQVDAAVSRALSGGALDKEIQALKAAVGSPLVATTAAAMTDRNKIYVYTGTEVGYTAGHWYYWNGSAWTDGGVYNAVAVDNALSPTSTNPIANKAVYDGLAAAEATVYKAFPVKTVTGSAAKTTLATSVPVKRVIANIAPIFGRGNTDVPSPNNPWTISGRESASFSIAATNLYNPDAAVNGKFIAADGTIGNNSDARYSALIPVVAGSTVRFIGKSNTTNSFNRRLHGYDIYGNWIAQLAAQNISTAGVYTVEATVPTNVAYVRISTLKADTEICVSQSATAFVAFDGATQNFDWSAVAGSIYGGTLAWDGTQWTLTVDKAIVDLTTLDWQFMSVLIKIEPDEFRTCWYAALPADAAESVPEGRNGYCNKGEVGQFSFLYQEYNFEPEGLLAGYNSVSYCNSDLNRDVGVTGSYVFSGLFFQPSSNFYLVYDVANPVTYVLDGDAVAAAFGENTAWCDGADSITVDYRADPTLYIADAIASI